MRAFLLIVLVLLPTAAQAQFDLFELNPTLGSTTSPSRSPAAHTAFGYATEYVRIEMGCRHALPIEQRAQLVEAATQVYLVVGYNLDGASVVLRELQRSLDSRPDWAHHKCKTQFSQFLENREQELRAVAELTVASP